MVSDTAFPGNLADVYINGGVRRRVNQLSGVTIGTTGTVSDTTFPNHLTSVTIGTTGTVSGTPFPEPLDRVTIEANVTVSGAAFPEAAVSDMNVTVSDTTFPGNLADVYINGGVRHELTN